MAAAPCIQEELYTVVRSQCSGGIIFPSPSLPFHSLDGTTALPYTVRTYLPYRYAALVAWLRQGCQGFFLNYILPLNFSNFTFSKKTTVTDGRCFLKKRFTGKKSCVSFFSRIWRLCLCCDACFRGGIASDPPPFSPSPLPKPPRQPTNQAQVIRCKQ